MPFMMNEYMNGWMDGWMNELSNHEAEEWEETGLITYCILEALLDNLCT